ncbi:MAG: alginate lyase family protein [Pirellulales bacterium]|nr:alginate lyase family protein [Pirellulales bacterium]
MRPSQVYWRLRYRRERSRPVVEPWVPEEIELRGDFPEVPLVKHDNDSNEFVAMLEEGRFGHLNKTKTLGHSPTDWLLGTASDDRLWTITLHYHAWAWELASRVVVGGDDANRADACLRRLLDDWITNCDLVAEGSRDLAWNAYAISTRIGWWCRLYHLLGVEGRKNWGELENTFLRSLWRQTAFLGDHIEWDLRANHVLRDAVGLAWAGRFFGGSQADEWMQSATKIALSQAAEQVLPDGGHFERSPMYHVHAMEDFLTLGSLVDESAAREILRETWRKMADMLAWMRHPDGQVPLFNDGGMNGACHPRDMLKAGCKVLRLEVDIKPRKGGKLFENFGMVVWHGQPWSLFFDVGPVGVDYQPGHAHADTLTIEASFEGERLFVDPGTFAYDNDEKRYYDRSTMSHNTLCVDSTDSSEVWHIFRVGRRAHPIGVSCDTTDNTLRATGSHDGYYHLDGRPCHTRRVEITDQGCLVIVDEISGRGRHSLEGGLLLAPGWTARKYDDSWEIVRHDKRVYAKLEADNVTAETLVRPYSPEYGRRLDVQRLAWRSFVELPYKLTWRIEKHP